MGTTTSGLPWPEPTAPVRNGAADIRALAEAVDARQGGVAWLTTGGIKTTDVNGIATFTNLPLTTVYGAVSCQAEIDGQGNIPDARIHRVIIGSGVPAKAVYVKVFKHDGTVVASATVWIMLVIWGLK